MYLAGNAENDDNDDNDDNGDNDIMYFAGQTPSRGDPGGGEKTSGGKIHSHDNF